MSEREKVERASNVALGRRNFLRAAGVAGGGLVASTLAGRAAPQGEPDPAITEVQDWARYLGDGVAVRPYGKPSSHEKHVVRRDVQ